KDFIMGKSALDKIEDIYLMQIEYNINKKINIFTKRIFDILFGVICIFTVYPVAFIGGKNNKFLRKIYYIPSVIKGELSFVGKPTWDKSSIGKRFLGKNGLTGLAQINYYKNLSLDEVEYYNFYYAKNQSLLLDIEVILKTISLFIFRKRLTIE
ncbi:MAG: sugar transferase, partial [Saprospiraceae bacterium]